MSLAPTLCSRCGSLLDLEMERDEGLCCDCLAEAAGCTNGQLNHYHSTEATPKKGATAA